MGTIPTDKLPGKSALAGLYIDTYCPLFLDDSCCEGFDFLLCPYKDGWRICIHYIKSHGKLDKSLSAVGDITSLSYVIYKDMVKEDE